MNYIKMRREALRKEMRALRNAVPDDRQQEASDQICRRLLSHEIFAHPCTVGSYVSFGREIVTMDINRALKQQGHLVGLPVIHPTRMGHMDFYAFTDEESMVPNRFHILEPAALPENRLGPDLFEVLLVPLTAFDRKGNRLGMGGGFYDRMLKRVSSQCLLIGLAYDFQEAPEVPVENWDMPVDEVITPTRHLIFSSKKY